MADDLTQVRQALRRQGWTVTQSRGSHYRASPPSGGQWVPMPCSPSDYRSIRDVICRLRRKGFVWQGR